MLVMSKLTEPSGFISHIFKKRKKNLLINKKIEKWDEFKLNLIAKNVKVSFGDFDS